MGQGNSKSEYGGMFIQTDLPYCIAGTTVTGKIYIQIYKQFPAEKLILKIKGKEIWTWTETITRTVGYGEDRRYEEIKIKHFERHNVFDFNHVIYNFISGWIPPGQYVFPFSFVLPKECPASSYYTGANKSVAFIRYSCKGICDAGHHTLIKDLKYKCRLVVRHVPANIHKNLYAEQETEIFKCWCWCSQGYSKFKCLFEKDASVNLNWIEV